MKRNSLIQEFAIGFSIVFFTITFTNVGFAQTEAATQEIYQVGYAQVKSGMNIEFEQLIKGALPYLQSRGIHQMLVCKTASFGTSDKYVFFTRLDDPAILDAELSESQSSIPAEFIPVLSTLNRTMAGGRDFMMVTRPDLSILPADDYELKLGVMFTVGVTPGRTAEFESGLKEVLAVIGKTNIKGVLAGKVALGGNMNEYLVTILYDSFVEMLKNGPAIEQALAAAKLTPVTGIVDYQGNEVLAFLPELGIQQASQ